MTERRGTRLGACEALICPLSENRIRGDTPILGGQAWTMKQNRVVVMVVCR